MMRFCRGPVASSKEQTPRSSYIKTYGPLPFDKDEDLKLALQDHLAATDACETRVRLILGALVQGVDRRWVRSRLDAWEVHPTSIILAERVPKLRSELAEALMPGQTEWTFGVSTVFRGPSLPRGLHLPGPLILDGCEGLVELPDDLSTPCLVIQNCRNLRSLQRVPPGVLGLQVEHAPNLIDLPDAVKLKNGFRLSACPQVEQLPSFIYASDIKISHCPGLRSLSSKIRCHRIELSTLINLTALDLDLTVSSNLELSLPSLSTMKGQVKVRGRFRLACTNLMSMEADINVGDQMVVEHCRLMESMKGRFHVKRGLFISRCPQLTATPEGIVEGNLELADLAALVQVDSGLCSSSRRVRIRRCEELQRLPNEVRLRGSMELIDLPSLAHWPDFMNVGILTVLGCPRLSVPPPGVIARTAFRWVSRLERQAMDRVLAEDSMVDRVGLELLRRLVRALTSAGVSLSEAVELLHADGHAKGDVLVASAAEGLGLAEFLDRCAALSDGRGGEVEAALACVRASIHPGSLALVVKDLTKARWLAELYSDSKDLAAGVTGDGNLRIQPQAAWDLPEKLAIPGQIRASQVEGEPRWPARMRVLGGIKFQPVGSASPSEVAFTD